MGQVILKEDSHQYSKVLIIQNDPEPLRDVSSGIVVSKGKDYPKGAKIVYRSISEVQEGDRVAYRSLTIEKNGKRYNLNEFKLNGEIYLNVPFEDILGVYD